MRANCELAKLSLSKSCQVYWGSHGCDLPKGHKGHHDCGCCICPDGKHTHEPNEDGVCCVATYPYYGPATNFYGPDVRKEDYDISINT